MRGGQMRQNLSRGFDLIQLKFLTLDKLCLLAGAIRTRAAVFNGSIGAIAIKTAGYRRYALNLKLGRVHQLRAVGRPTPYVLKIRRNDAGDLPQPQLHASD